MPKSILIRNLSSEDSAWISRSIPPGMTQEAYVKSLISEARTRTSDLQTPMPPHFDQDSRFTFVDLFAGIGGFYFGMTSLGGRCVFTSEWDRHAVATYRAWTGETRVYTEDIRLLDPLLIPDHDVLCGGFPCQPFSIAGVSKKISLGRAHGFDDEKQGNLFFTICAIVSAKRPPVLLLENVKNLRSHDRGNTWKVITDSLDGLGYAVRWQTMDARGWVPQHRERIFLVCFNHDDFTESEVNDFEFPVTPEPGPRLRSVLESKAPDKKYMLTDGLWSYLQEYAAKHRARGNGFGYGLVGVGDVSRTLSARYYKDGSEILIKQRGWRNPRRLTPREAARLMGFDRRFSEMVGHAGELPQVVSDTQAYKQFGNAVSPLVVEAIGTELIKTLSHRNLRLEVTPRRRAS